MLHIRVDYSKQNKNDIKEKQDQDQPWLICLAVVLCVGGGGGEKGDHDQVADWWFQTSKNFKSRSRQ